MTNLVKRLRHAAKWASLSGEAADEIERLEKLVESQNTILTSSTNGRVRKAVIEDVREWDPPYGDEYRADTWRSNLDAYAKDRGIE